MTKKTVLFICTHNSSRSQIAEGFLNSLFASNYKAYSAGLKPSILNPYAFEVMKEIGIDLSNQSSKSIEKFKEVNFDYVVTVCDNAKETCPFFLGKKIIHKSFEDPASFKGNIEDTLKFFRKVRDRIKEFIIETFGKN